MSGSTGKIGQRDRRLARRHDEEILLAPRIPEKRHRLAVGRPRRRRRVFDLRDAIDRDAAARRVCGRGRDGERQADDDADDGRWKLHGWDYRSAAPARGQLLHRGAAKAGLGMVVDDPRRLHEGVDDGRADKFEAAPLELLGHRPWRAGSAPARGRGSGSACRRRGVQIVVAKSSFDLLIPIKICAPLIVASIFARERMIPASAMRRAMSLSPKRATFAGSKFRNADRNASRLRRTVIQARPA